LLPTTLYLASGISADTYTNIVAFSFISLVLYLRTFEAEFSKKQYILLIVGLFLLVFAKPTYTTLALMLFLVPKLKVSFKLSAVFFTAIAVLGLMMIGGKVTVPARIDVLVDPKVQLHYIFDNPYVFLNSIADYFIINSGLFVKQCIAVFDWTLTFLPAWIYYCLLPLILLSPFSVKEKILFIIVFSVFMVAVMQFLTWVPAGETLISGFQGRYLIPFLPLFLILIQDIFVFKYKLPSIVLILGVFLGLMFSVNTIVHRFYI
jgi:uncharacterized membrane protein